MDGLRRWIIARRRKPGTGTRVNCSIGAFDVSLRSDLPEVLENFVSLYPLRSPTTGDPNPTIEIEVRNGGRSRVGRRLYRVFADGQEIGGWRSSNGVFPLIEWGINLRIMETRNEYLQFHAASMSYQGRGVIFAGDSGCGKSTLAAILLARGWRYFCDEFALLDVETLRLQPFPKALCIKAGSYPVVNKLGLRFARRCDYVKAFKGRVGYVNPRDLGPDAIATPTGVCAVVFPGYHAGEKAQMREIPHTHAALRLLRHCFNRDRFPDGATPALVQLMNHVQCFELDVGPPNDTGLLLETCFGAVPPRDAAIRPSPTVRRRDNPSQRRTPNPLRTRRDLLRMGAKFAYVAPAVLMLSARNAFAAASNPSGVCSTAKNTGELCETDADCCSRRCDFGLCD